LYYANNLAGWARKGWITDLEALAQLSDYAVSMLPADVSNRTAAYVNDMSYVLIGSEGAGVLLTSFFAASHTPPEFGDTGFHENYQDRQNQPYHFWAYVATIANANNTGGWALANAGNIYHELLDPLEAFRTINRGGLSGISWEDYHLAHAGAAMGKYLAEGTLPIEKAGHYMRAALSTEYPGTGDNLDRSLGTWWWPSKIWERVVIKYWPR